VIGRPELSRLAVAGGVGERAQEKDYVLAWLLAARAALGPSSLVFKGGTALRLCYFAGYRYSEDLDFTTDESLDAEALAIILGQWCQWVQDQVGIRATRVARAAVSATTSYITYVGPLLAGDSRDIKIDVATDEVIRDENDRRALISGYSDLDGGAYFMDVYGLMEIWAEKVRSLIQRSEPRDLYDLDQLLAHDGSLPDRAADLFRRKAIAKDLDPTNVVERLEARERTFERHWKNRLATHVVDLSEFNGAWRRVLQALRRAGYQETR
jgi:uncharacterized protein